MVYNERVGVIVPFMQKHIKLLSLAVAGLFAATVAATSLMQASAADQEIDIYGDTATTYNEKGTWQFNRDKTTQSPFEFTTDTATLGNGSLYVQPISNTINGNKDKFIAEYYANVPIGELESFSYDFQVGPGGSATDAQEFYLNVYANFTENDDYGDCIYSAVPESADGWTTFTFDPDSSYDVRQRNEGPNGESCPSVPSDMGPNGEFRAFAINLGDTGSNDQDLDGYFDNVVLTTSQDTITYDFEPIVVDETDPVVEITNPLNGEVVSGDVTVEGTITDDNNNLWRVVVRDGETNEVVLNSGNTSDDSDVVNASYTFDSSQLEDGEYRIVLIGIDDSDNSGRDRVVVTVDNRADTKDECKDGGWQMGLTLEQSFRNQGDCVSYFATDGRNQPAGDKKNESANNTRRR